MGVVKNQGRRIYHVTNRFAFSLNYAVKFLTLMKLWKCGGRYGIMGLMNEDLYIIKY